MGVTFDRDEAKKAVSRVKERSIGPRTVYELADLLDLARRAVAEAEQDLGLLKSQMTKERRQLDKELEQLQAALTQARADRDAARAHEQADAEEWAIARTAADRLRVCETELLRAVAAYEQATAEVATLKAQGLEQQLQVRIAVSQAHEASRRRTVTLATIVAAPWWRAGFVARRLSRLTETSDG